MVGAGIFLSRAAGLVRERVFAHYFGNSVHADVWRAATRMPNVLRNLLGEGTLSASFIPIYARYLEEGKDEDAGRFAGAILGLLFVVSGALVLLGVLLAPWLVAVLVSGFDADAQALTTSLVRIIFPMTGLLVIAAWALGVLNSHRKFFLSYVAPVLWNLSVITALIGAGFYLGLEGADLLMAMGWGALVGGALQLAVQLPSVLASLRFLRPSVSLSVPGVREAIRNFVPVLGARGAVNISSYLDTWLASFLVTGALSVLGYAQILYLLPISLFGMSIAASELPELSRTGEGAEEEVRARLQTAMRRVVYLVVPSTIGYLAFGDLAVGAIFQTGAFGAEQTRVTYMVLAAYSIGLLASAGSRVMSSAFYGLRDTRTPAKAAYVRVAVSAVLGISLMIPLDQVAVGASRLGAVGLALGASVAAWLEVTMLSRSLRGRVGDFLPGAGSWARYVGSGLLALAVGAGVRMLLAGVVGPESGLQGTWQPVLEALITLAPFGLVYLGAVRAFERAGGPILRDS